MKNIKPGAIALVFLFLGSAYAGEIGQWRISPAIGYATIDLADVNKDTVDFAKYEVSDFVDYLNIWSSIGSAKYSVEQVESGFVGSMDLGYQVSSQGGVGFRFGYLKPGDITMKVTGSGNGGESIYDKGTISMSVISVMAGGWIEGGEKVGLNYSGFLYAGPSFASSETTRKYQFSDTVLSIYSTMGYTAESSGSAFGADLGGKFGYGFSEKASVFIEAGYRILAISKMKATKDVDMDKDGIVDVEKGDVENNIDGDPLEYAFSGISLKVGVQYLF